MNLIGKNVVVYGAGVSGLAAYGLIRERGGRAIIFDDNSAAEHATSSPGVFANADLIVISPGVKSGNSYVLDARLDGVPVISELELASQVCLGEQIAVTGTNGKTTTVSLIESILHTAHLSARAVGNIGVPFSDYADKMDATETAVIEASSFQLESAISFAPDIAVMLNITPDHLERHGNMRKYTAAKSNIFLRQTETDYVVYNADDERIRDLCPLMKAKKVPFSLSAPVDGAYISSDFLCFKGTPVVAIDEVDFCGREMENALAAVAVGCIKGINPYTIATAVSSFKRPQFRRQKIGTIKGIDVYNDSKATNIDSTLAALQCESGKCVVILGGAKRGEDFDFLFSLMPKNVSGAVASGENCEEISKAANRARFDNLEIACDLEEALDKAFDLAKKTEADSVYFSPASKSFDHYHDYVERGKAFDNIFTQRKDL